MQPRPSLPTTRRSSQSAAPAAGLAERSPTCRMLRRAFTALRSRSTHTHYHREHTEIYYILECAAGAAIELDDERVPVTAGHAVMIPPLVRHRAVGRMTVLNVVVPPFDPADEWFD